MNATIPHRLAYRGISIGIVVVEQYGPNQPIAPAESRLQ